MTRRMVLTLFGALTLIGSTQHCSKPLEATLAPLRLARNFWPGNFWEDVAVEKDWFREEGLEVESVDFNDDYVASLRAVVEGRIDTQNINLFDVVSYNRKGAGLIMVAVADYSNGGDAVLARPGITNISDLRGRRVGLATDTYFEFFLNQALRSEGLSVADISIVPIQVENAAVEFRKQNLDAVVTFGPSIEKVIANGGHVLFDSSSFPSLLPSVLPFRREFVERRPKDVEKFVRVFSRSTQWMRTHPDETWAIVARRWHMTPEAVKAAAATDSIVDLAGNKTAFAYGSGSKSVNGIFQLMDDFIREDDHGTRLDSAEFIDSRFIVRATWNDRR